MQEVNDKFISNHIQQIKRKMVFGHKFDGKVVKFLGYEIAVFLTTTYRYIQMAPLYSFTTQTINSFRSSLHSILRIYFLFFSFRFNILCQTSSIFPNFPSCLFLSFCLC
eukprot:280357_1